MSSEQVATKESNLSESPPEDITDYPSSQSQESDDEHLACATDAGHPRLLTSHRLAEAEQNSFYCEMCDVNFYPRELDDHFNKHKPFESCQYCGTAVYRYVVKKTSKVEIYHTCSYNEPESISPASPDVNMNI